MRKLNCILLAVLLGLVAGLASLPAAADDRADRGKELAVQGLKAYQGGDYQEALELFEEARTLYPTGQVLRMYGYTLLGLKRWVPAAEALEEALSTKLKPLPDDVRPEVQQNLDKALSHLGTVTIETNVQGATVIIDTGEEELLPVEDRRLLEGSHSLVGKAEGRKELVVEVDVTAKESQTIRLDFPVRKPEPEPEPEVDVDPTMRVLGLTFGAAGLLTAGIGAATLASGVSMEDWTEDRISSYNVLYRTGCSADQYASCSYEAAAINQQAGRAETLQGVGVGLLIGGAALAATGVTLFLLAPSGSAGSAEPSDSSDSATLGCGPYGWAGLGCQGAF